MFIAIILLFIAGDSVSGKLIGDNVCQEEKRYTINVTEYFTRNYTIRNYQWCMNVPPRCSFYTTKLTNESRVVEKEVADIVDVCCSGYVEDSDRCIPECPECNNGTCNNGKCDCHLGYKGEFCEFGCNDLEWGKNCRFKCDCGGAGCHAKTGKCFCPPGWTGNKCDYPCEDGFFGANCQQQCACPSCDHITGQCPTTSTSPPITIPFNNNGKLTFISSTVLPTDEMKITAMPLDNYISAQTNAGPVQITKYAKAKVKEKEVTEAVDEENYLADDTSRGNPEVNKNDLVNSASAATAISVGIIIVAGVIVAANHFKGKKRKSEGGSKGVSTVAVYTHSIFHTPLPDPPLFENPVFTNPAPSETNSSSNEGRFETHVVCSMNFPTLTPTKDPREYLYDHPPSTGSYRAACVPEPPDLEIGMHLEPLYDEIPSGVAPTPVTQPPPAYKSSGSLYMNTFGKTRF